MTLLLEGLDGEKKKEKKIAMTLLVEVLDETRKPLR